VALHSGTIYRRAVPSFRLQSSPMVAPAEGPRLPVPVPGKSNPRVLLSITHLTPWPLLFLLSRRLPPPTNVSRRSKLSSYRFSPRCSRADGTGCPPAVSAAANTAAANAAATAATASHRHRSFRCRRHPFQRRSDPPNNYFHRLHLQTMPLSRRSPSIQLQVCPLTALSPQICAAAGYHEARVSTRAPV
jgi:hypothetical protein